MQIMFVVGGERLVVTVGDDRVQWWSLPRHPVQQVHTPHHFCHGYGTNTKKISIFVESY